jgi:hypothetical protein
MMLFEIFTGPTDWTGYDNDATFVFFQPDAFLETGQWDDGYDEELDSLPEAYYMHLEYTFEIDLGHDEIRAELIALGFQEHDLGMAKQIEYDLAE